MDLEAGWKLVMLANESIDMTYLEIVGGKDQAKVKSISHPRDLS